MKTNCFTLLSYWLISLFAIAANAADINKLTIKINDIYPHPNNAFTQGFIINNGEIAESSGRYNKSFVQRYNIGDSTAAKLGQLPGHYFAEGLDKIGDEIFVLTWKERSLLVLNNDDFSLIRKMRYQGEGWGLTTNQQHLIMSDGSNTITFRAKKDFTVVREISVSDDTGPVKFLNELEWIDGKLYANVWQKDLIVVINPNNGEVTAKIDLWPLRDYLNSSRKNGFNSTLRNSQIDVINGIAWDKTTQQLYLTGKLWPWIFSVSIVDK